MKTYFTKLKVGTKIMKHTKGKWEADGIYVCRKDIPATKNKLAAATYLCTMELNGIDLEEAKANACLIAAAPDLLEVCIECLNLFEANPRHSCGSRTIEHKLRDVIGKTVGNPSLFLNEFKVPDNV